MSDAGARLLEQAVDLPVEDRREMAERLAESVDLEEAHAADPDYEEHLAEIVRRSDEAHAHPERLLTWDQVYPEMLAELERRGAARKADGNL